MGNFLSQIRGFKIAIDPALLNATHSKLIEYYSSYKSICEGYTINVVQYTQIFGGNQLSFTPWECDGRGKIDALEMFCGLIIFSKAKYEQKIKFLFEIFDFNEQGFLEYENMIFMLIHLCNATFKVLGINKTISQSSIQSFLDQYFTQDTQIELPRLIRWTTKNVVVNQFFKEIGFEIEHPPEIRRIDEYILKKDQKRKKNQKINSFDREFRLDPKFINTLENLIDNRRVAEQETLNFQFSWIYGIDVGKQNLKYVKLEKQKAGNERIIYSVGKIIIIYLPKLNSQLYYTGHAAPISVIEISKYKKFVVSAESGEWPSIHIWDFESRINLMKFTKIHKDPIKFVKLFHGDRLLITVSQSVKNDEIQSPVVILRLDTKQTVMSSYIKFQIIGIAIQSFGQQKSTAYLIGKTSITVITPIGKSFNLEKKNLKLEADEQIIAFVYHPDGYMISAHQGRVFYRWDSKFNKALIKYESESNLQVIQMVFINKSTLAILDKEDVEIVQINSDNFIKNRAIQIKGRRLFNLQLCSMQAIVDSKILLLSQFGDLIKINCLIQSRQFTFQKYHSIFKMDDIYNIYLPDNKKIVFASSCFLYFTDKFEHQLNSLVKYEFQLRISDNNKQNLVVANTLQGRLTDIFLISFLDYSIKQSYRFQCFIEDVKITDHHIIAFSQNTLFVFPKTQDKFMTNKPNELKLTIGRIVNVAKETDQKVLLLTNDSRDIFKLTISGNSQIDIQKIDKQQDSNSHEQLSFIYYEQNYKYPFAVNANRKFVALGRKNGEMFVWQSLGQAVSNFASYSLYNFHNQRISRFLFNPNEFYSAGGQDGMVIQYQHKKYVQIEDQFQYFETKGNKKPKPITKTIWKQNEIKKSAFLKEVKGCNLRQSNVELLGLSEINNQQSKQVIQEMLKKAISNTDKISKIQANNQTLFIEPDFIYGIQSTVLGKNIYYVHSYDLVPQTKIKQQYWPTIQSQSQKQQLQYSKDLLVPIDQDHPGCKRQIIYCCGRYCVLKQKGMPQRIYPFHRRKVSAIGIHPNRQIICSCEVSSTYAQLQFWRHNHRNLLVKLVSSHWNIITRAQFSRDGQWVVTLGGLQRMQSIQVFNWQNQQTIAFRYIEDEILKDILFNPYDKRQFCSIGTNLIRIYSIAEHLFLKQELRVQDQNFQAMAYTSNIYGPDIESDVITGSQEGDIGLYACGSFIICRKKAHERAVTCLRLAELFQYKKVLISGGQDSFVRIWDIKFNQISKKNIRDQLYSVKSSALNMPKAIITSVDLYQCQKKGSGQLNTTAILLIAASDGSILEATITNQFEGYRAVILPTAESQMLKQKINFDASLTQTLPSSFPGFGYELIRNFIVTYTKEDRFLIFWNTHFQSRQKVYPLTGTPLFVVKMNSQDIILVGIQDQSRTILRMFQLKWSAGLYIQSITECGALELQKGSFTPSNVIFSLHDNWLALKVNMEEHQQVWVYQLTNNLQKKFNYCYRFLIQQKQSRSIEWMDFSTKQDALLIAWNSTKQDSNSNFDIKYRCYHMPNGAQMSPALFQFSHFDFSSKIKAYYIPCLQLNINSQNGFPIVKDPIKLTTMIQYNQFFLIGTNSGEILIATYEILAARDNDPKYASTFVVADNPIQHLEVRDNELIVSCKNQEAIYVFKLKVQRGFKNQAIEDQLTEVLNLKQVEQRIKKRKKIQTQVQFSNNDCGIVLKLSAVIGRNALYKRNNIFVDLKDNIIAFSGCNLLLMKHVQGQRLQQQIIKPDKSSGSCHPEISCIILGQCKRFLLVGTREENAKIIAWDISTNTYLFDIKLNGFISINQLKLSSNNKYSILLAIAKNGHQAMIFVNIISKSVLAVHHFHKAVHINDISFPIGYDFRVLVCGVMYMAQWTYCNNLLTEHQYNFSSNSLGEELKTQAITFYSVIFIDEYAICSGSDGYLYVWKNEKVVKRQNAHPKQPILSLYASPNSKIFVSGANNGSVIIWHFSSSLIIQKLDQYASYNGKQQKVPIKYQIQSICMTKESLVIGNRAGQIFHFPFSADLGKEQKQKQKDKQKSNTAISKAPQPILSAFNHEDIKDIAFNPSAKKLYVITDDSKNGYGTFSVFDVASLEKVKEEKIELKSEVIRMFVCKSLSRIILVLKSAIIVYRYQSQAKQERYNKITVQAQEKMQMFVKAAALNKSQNILAVLIYSSQSEITRRIDLYYLQKEERSNKIFRESKILRKDIPMSVQIIDFSHDHEYLVYQASDGDQTILDLNNFDKTIKPATLENPPEWIEDAKKTVPFIKEISSFYTQDNGLKKVVQVMKSSVIATDQIGTVRVFPYPITASKDQSYQAYIQHLNMIHLCTLSSDDRILATVSQQDKAIHIWDVIHK